MKKIIVITTLLLCGCGASGLDKNAERVRVIKKEPSEKCEFLGMVTGSQGNFMTGGLTSNANLETGALNSLRNKTAKLGGNTVSLLTERAGNSGSSFDGTGSTQQVSVTMTGNAWRCP